MEYEHEYPDNRDKRVKKAAYMAHRQSGVRHENTWDVDAHEKHMEMEKMMYGSMHVSMTRVR